MTCITLAFGQNDIVTGSANGNLFYWKDNTS
jgi:hypothetical protein